MLDEGINGPKGVQASRQFNIGKKNRSLNDNYYEELII